MKSGGCIATDERDLDTWRVAALEDIADHCKGCDACHGGNDIGCPEGALLIAALDAGPGGPAGERGS